MRLRRLPWSRNRAVVSAATSTASSTRDPGAEPAAHARRRAEPAADPHVVADPEVRSVHADQADVVDLVLRAVVAAARDGDLVLAGQVREAPVADEVGDERVHDGARVEVLVRRDAGQRAADDVAPHVAAGLRAGQADLVEGREDVRHVLQPQPVELDALPGGDVGEGAAVADREVGDRPQLPRVQLPVRDAHPQHEVAVLLGPLRVDAPPLREGQVVRLERGEAAVACRVDEIVDDVEPVLPFLDPLDLGAQVPFLGHASTSRWGWP